MPKAILKFDLGDFDEQLAFKRTMNADGAYRALWFMQAKLTEVSCSDNAVNAAIAAAWLDELDTLLEENEILLDDLQ